jgi:hypothetical protein
MRKLGVMAFFAVVAVGCGSSGGGSSGGGSSTATYNLPGASGFDIPAGSCTIVNTAPQDLPASQVSYHITDHYDDDNLEVGIVLSSNTCQFNQADSYIDDALTGTGGDSGSVAAGTYDFDIICQNAADDCVIDSATWTATY